MVGLTGAERCCQMLKDSESLKFQGGFRKKIHEDVVRMAELNFDQADHAVNF